MPAKIGLANFMFAPINSETSTAPPTYKEPVHIGGAVQANLTLNFASGQDHADNVLTEEVNDFESGTLATEIDNIELKTESTIYGSEMDSETGELSDTVENSPPYGGLAYYQLLRVNGKDVYRGIFYPKTKAVLGADNVQTKAGNVTFQHTNPTFTIFNPLYGSWRYRKEFEKKEDVVDWLNEKFGTNGAGD